MTTVNQATGVRSRSGEPLKTLGTYRRGSTLQWDADPSWRSLVFFGTSLVLHCINRQLLLPSASFTPAG